MLNLANLPITANASWQEDFDKTILSTSTNTAGANSGFIAITPINANKNVFGAYRLSNGTSNTGSVRVFTNNLTFEIGGGITYCKNRLAIASLTTALQNSIFRIGIGDVITATTTDQDHVNGIYFEYNRGVSLNWRICTSSASVRTKVNTLIPVVVGDHSLHYEVNEASNSVEFFINGLSAGSITTNIPINVPMGFNAYLKKIIGTTPYLISLDYAQIFKRFSKGR